MRNANKKGSRGGSRETGGYRYNTKIHSRDNKTVVSDRLHHNGNNNNNNDDDKLASRMHLCTNNRFRRGVGWFGRDGVTVQPIKNAVPICLPNNRSRFVSRAVFGHTQVLSPSHISGCIGRQQKLHNQIKARCVANAPLLQKIFSPLSMRVSCIFRVKPLLASR